MILVTAAIGVALLCFIIYALDRRSRSEPIVWEQAGKLSIFGGIVAAGLVFAIGMNIEFMNELGQRGTLKINLNFFGGSTVVEIGKRLHICNEYTHQ